MLKKCRICKLEKPLEDFHVAKRNRDGRQYICKLCEKDRKQEWYSKNKEEVLKKQKEYYAENSEEILLKMKTFKENDYPKNLAKYMLRRAKERASKKQIPFDLTIDDIQIPKFCPILGLELSVSERNGDKSKSPSLDRIIPELGYVRDNIQVISNLANTMKNCATKDQLNKFAIWVLTRQHNYDTIRKFIGEIKNEN